MKSLRSLYQALSLLWRRLNHRSRCFIRRSLSFIMICLVIRGLPYLAPIRAVDLRQDQQAVTFVDRHNLPLGTLLTRDQNHTAVVNLSQVSPQFIQAILAAEDERFYHHGALSIRAIGRALLEAGQARKIVSGASTITMQLARLLEPGADRPFAGKLHEIWLAWRLAAGMSRDEILQAYINRLPMGGNVYGVEAAARLYFGIPAQDLNLAQASLLAGLPNDPNQLHPYYHWAALKRRQQYVLNRMVKAGKITRTQADRTITSDITLQPRQQGIIAAPHWLFWLAQQLPATHPAQIRTTLDRPLQQFVTAQLQQVLQPLASHNAHQAAALVLHNPSGEVLAYVGSADYFGSDRGQNDGVQALRQPGSTLKPLLYQLAIATRVIRPNTILADVPTHYAIPGAKLYSPSDYSDTFQGPVRVRLALANSLNVPAVKVLEKVGVANFLNHLHQLGFAHLTQPADYYGLGLALGSGEVSLWELARAYVGLARPGEKVELRGWLDGRANRSGQERSKPSGQVDRPVDRASTLTATRLITDMLSDPHARARSFGVDSALQLPFPAAVKTGTSSDFRDTWTVGYTTDYTVAVWVGNFDGEPMQQISGVAGAAPLWQRIMVHLHEQQEPAAFLPPSWQKRPICALSGLKPTPLCPTVVQEYFAPEDLAQYEQQVDRVYQPHGNGYRLNLPTEYDEWIARQSQPKSGLKILSPQPNDVFLLTDHQPQKLEIKLAVPTGQPVEWRLNGQRLSVATESWFWPMQPGNWRLQVQSKNLSDQVDFQVQVASPSTHSRAHRRGFSRAPK
jgi:penicillin-binding protein 1C